MKKNTGTKAPLSLRSDAEIAKHLLFDESPLLNDSIFLDFAIKEVDADDLNGKHAKTLAVMDKLFGLLIERYHESFTCADSIDCEALPHSDFLGDQRKSLMLPRSLTGDYCPSADSVFSQMHAVADSSSILALFINTCSEVTFDFPWKKRIFCIPPAALQDEQIAHIYQNDILPSSKCLFNQCDHPEIMKYLNGTALLPDKLYLPLYQSLMLHNMPSTQLDGHGNPTSPCYRINKWNLKNKINMLLSPSDTPELIHTVRKCITETLSKSHLRFYEKQLNSCVPDIHMGSLPALVQELVARDRVLVPIWEHALSIQGKDNAYFDDLATTWDKYGIRGYLETVAAGVPIEDIIA